MRNDIIEEFLHLMYIRDQWLPIWKTHYVIQNDSINEKALQWPEEYVIAKLKYEKLS